MSGRINFHSNITAEIHNTSGLNQDSLFYYIKMVCRNTIIADVGFSEDTGDAGLYSPAFPSSVTAFITSCFKMAAEILANYIYIPQWQKEEAKNGATGREDHHDQHHDRAKAKYVSAVPSRVVTLVSRVVTTWLGFQLKCHGS